MKPLVSVIIPTYNREKFLRQAIESAAQQSYSNIEILVVDDGSRQNYAEAICAAWCNCRYLYKENEGASAARNYGVRHATGSLIAFLDDDDLWKEGKIDRQVQLLMNHPEVALVHAASEVIDEHGERSGKIIGAFEEKATNRSGWVFWNALGVWTVKASTPLIRKSVFRDTQFFDERLKAAEDSDFYQRLFYRYKVLYMNEPQTYYRVYGDSGRLSLQDELYRGVEPIMYENLIAMGIKNPLVRYRIGKRLLRYAKSNRRKRNNGKGPKISRFDQYFRPGYCLRRHFIN